jgi:hypothetical protein
VSAIEQWMTQQKQKHCKEDVVYFINQLKTFDPRTQNKDLKFILYPFQEDYVKQLVFHIKSDATGNPDLFVEKSRDMGVSWVTLAVIYWFFKYVKGFQALIGSRKEEYVDDWTMKSLFPKIEYLAKSDPFPCQYERKYMNIINKDNGSVIQGESANANFSRAGRYNVILFDELAFWPWQQSSWEAAGDATPCRIAVSTPSPEPSYAKALRNSGLAKLLTLHWRLHPLKNDEWYERERLRRTSDEIARELDINWEGSLTGIVYPEIEHAILGDYPFIPNSPLYVSWDFGLDGMAIQWWQDSPTGKKRLIYSYHNQDKVIEYYFPLFGFPINSIHNYRPEDLELINIVKDLPKAIHFGDPDVNKRNLQTGTSNRQELEKANIYVQTNDRMNDLESRKTETKLILQKGVEVNDNPQNRFWLECMKNARYPQRDDTSQSVTPNLKPIHDWTSHHRTSTEYYAVNVKDVTTEIIIPKEREYDSITGRLIS